MMNPTSIKELVSQTMAAMEMMGLSTYSVWSEYGHSFLPIIRRHEQEGKETFDRDIVETYMREFEIRFKRGEISLYTYRNQKRGVGRLTEMHDVGRLEWTVPKKISRFVLNEYYEKIVADFVSQEDVSAKTKSDK